MEQYSNLNVHGRIKQKASQGTASDDVLLVSGIAPLSSTPATTTGETQTYFKGQTAVVNGATYICSDVTSSGSGSSKTWTYTWTPMSSPDNVTGPSEAVNEHVAVFDGTTGKAIKDSGFTIGKSVPSNAVFTDDHVTAVGNHYTPTKSTTKSASGGSNTNITTSTNATNVVTGIEMDAAGHVTGVTSKALYSTDQSVTAVGNHYTPSGGTTTSASGGTDTDLTNLASGNGINVVVGVTKDAAGHVTGVTSKALRSVNTVTTASNSGTGNLVTGVTANNGALTITKGIGYTTTADPSKIVQRKSDGQITVPESPDADTDAASKKFVNSSISNNTAKFLGTYEAAGTGTKALGIAQATVDAFTYIPDSTMESTTASAIATKLSGQTVSNLDYVFVAVNKSTTTVPSTVDWFWRFKATVSGSTTTWEYEFTLNNSSFTQAQWNAINSGIEASDVTKLDGIESGAQVNTVTGVKGNSESTYRTGNINITKSNIGLSNVENTALSTKVVASTGSASTPIYIDSSGVTQPVTSVSTSLIATASPSSGGTGGSNGLMTAADKEKLNSIASGAEVNVQADWNQTNTGADDYIKNKPTIPTIPDVSVTVTGSGNAVSSASASGHAITLTKGITAVTKTGNSTANQVVLWNGTDSVVKASNQSALTPGVSIATDSGTNALTMAHATKYKLTVGASTFIFTTPSDNNTDTLVKQTAQASTTTSYPLLASAQSSPTSGTAYEAKYSTSCYIKSNEVYSNGYATWNTNSLPFAATDVTLADM